jgi:hypothetical protein
MLSSMNPPRKRRFIFFGLLLFVLACGEVRAQAPAEYVIGAPSIVRNVVAVAQGDGVPDGKPKG